MTNNSIRRIESDINKCGSTVNFSLARQLKSLSFNCYLLSLLTCFVLIGCSTTQPPVPVVDRVKPDSSSITTPPTEANNGVNQFYIVQKGDTLYSIALNHGIDFKRSIERIGPLLTRTRIRLQELQIRNIHLRHADGSRGLAEAAPFDGIIMTAVTTHVPTLLLEQLVIGGKMIFPRGTQKQNLCIIERNSQGFTETMLEEVNFVPLLSGVVKK